MKTVSLIEPVLSRLAGKFQESFLYLPCAGIIDTAAVTQPFMWVLGIKTPDPRLTAHIFTGGAISPVPACFFVFVFPPVMWSGSVAWVCFELAL